MTSNDDERNKRNLRLATSWIVLIGISLVTAVFLYGAVVNFMDGQWLLEIAN